MAELDASKPIGPLVLEDLTLDGLHGPDRVRRIVEYVWEDSEASVAWLTGPHTLLDGRTPLAEAESEGGAACVERILWNLLYGLPV